MPFEDEGETLKAFERRVKSADFVFVNAYRDYEQLERAIQNNRYRARGEDYDFFESPGVYGSTYILYEKKD